MALNYRKDPDLEFLAFLSEEQLQGLARYLTHDTDGSERFVSELLTHAAFKQLVGHPEQHRKNWQLIAAELQYFGGDSIANALRRKGVPYRVIVGDVAARLKVKIKKEDSAESVERSIVAKVLGDAWEAMDDKQRQALLLEAGIDASRSEVTGLAGIEKLLAKGGPASFPVVTLAAEMISQLVFRQSLTTLVGSSLMRPIGALAGPIGLATALVTSIQALTGTAYRVTVPVVLHMAYLRHANQQQDHF